MELKGLDLQRLASVQPQLQFYQEARIKTAVFMGCMAGEIELGFSNDTTQVNWEMEMRKWMPENFPDQQAPYQDLPPPPDHQTHASSSSSSLRSLSTDNSLEPSPFLFNIPSTSYHQEPPKQPLIHEQAFRPTSSSVLMSPLHQAIQSFNQTRNFPFPTPETEDDAITKAILAVLSSPSPSASPSASSPQPSVAQNFPYFSRNATSAFNRYSPGFAHSSSTPMIARVRRSSMLKRAISFFRSLSSMRNQGRVQVHGGSRPTENQLYHMISERKRREKLNESFQALRSLLPPGTKKDKASVLSGTSEYLNSLRSQVVELTRRNQVLETQLLPKTKPRDDQEGSTDESSYRRLDVKVVNVVAAESSSSSGARIVDLFVVVRGGGCDVLDLVIGILEFLKKDERVGFISVEADTKVEESISVNRVVSRLKIEGSEWDESTFQEAVGKVVADLAK
ncbi:putative transcription factor bHLH041 isoform X1 [Rhododendron vialii]|uniref:putative transcription factor bHLH041 isoform X1 n=1 Tax=Rhododendron vialii TaxID=182163 RepID=UPI00265F7C40|nr:putative transcription factor bHLH041 isoform X1 [Rhododendron vialii]